MAINLTFAATKFKKIYYEFYRKKVPKHYR